MSVRSIRLKSKPSVASQCTSSRDCSRKSGPWAMDRAGPSNRLSSRMIHGSPRRVCRSSSSKKPNSATPLTSFMRDRYSAAPSPSHRGKSAAAKTRWTYSCAKAVHGSPGACWADTIQARSMLATNRPRLAPFPPPACHRAPARRCRRPAVHGPEATAAPPGGSPWRETGDREFRDSARPVSRFGRRRWRRAESSASPLQSPPGLVPRQAAPPMPRQSTIRPTES